MPDLDSFIAPQEETTSNPKGETAPNPVITTLLSITIISPCFVKSYFDKILLSNEGLYFSPLTKICSSSSQTEVKHSGTAGT